MGPNIVKFGDFCILIFRIFGTCNSTCSFDTQSFDRIFQFSLFFGPRIAFWPEIRDPDLLKHALGPNIMKFGDCCILIFHNTDPVSGPFFLCFLFWYCIDAVSILYRYCIDTVSCFDKLEREISRCWSILAKNQIISLRKLYFHDWLIFYVKIMFWHARTQAFEMLINPC